MIERIVGIGGASFCDLHLLGRCICNGRHLPFYLRFFGDAAAGLIVAVFVCQLIPVLGDCFFYETVQLVISVGGRQAGLQALAEYNVDPYDVNAAKITFSDVYARWSERKFKEVSESNVKGYKAAYKLCTSLYDMRMIDIKLSHPQDVVDNSGKNTPTLRKLKVLLGQMFEYAVINEIITKDKNIVEYVDIKAAGNPNKIDCTPFSDDEIQKVWDNVDCNEYMTVILMLIYSGVRVSELLELKKEDVHLGEKWFNVRHTKTQAGIRTVPIADKTYKFFEYWYNKNDCEYLLSTPGGAHFEYRNYYDSYWKPLLKELNIKHLPFTDKGSLGCISSISIPFFIMLSNLAFASPLYTRYFQG